MNKKYLIFLILLLIPLSYAVEYDWLISESTTNNAWNSNIQDTSLALLALKDSGETLDNKVKWLETKIKACIQTNSCTIKDASLALMALNEFSSDTTEIQTWLSSASIFQYGGSTENWKAQIVSTSAGSCKILDSQNPSSERTVTVNADFTPLIDLQGLITSTTSSIKIDCTSLSATPTALSILRAEGTTFYINKEVTSQKQATLDLGYSCWGAAASDLTCDPESTAYVLLVLTQKDPKWLELQSSLTPLQNAILYKITNKNTYLTKVLDAQNKFGYWGSANIYDTALIYSLIPDSDEKEKTASWITQQKAEDETCWPKPETLCKVRSTAAVLYSNAFTESTAEANATTERIEQQEDRQDSTELMQDCFDLGPGTSCITEDGYNGVCDDWGQCIKGSSSVKEDCSTLGEGSPCTTEDGYDGICDAFGDCIASESETPQTEGAGETEKKSSTLFWFLMVLLLLIILAGGGYYSYKKGWLKFKKTPKKPSASSPSTPFRHPLAPASQIRSRIPTEHPVKKRIAGDLDKSIREMERFLKGKKK